MFGGQYFGPRPVLHVPCTDHPDAFRVVVSWQTHAGDGKTVQVQAVAHKDWPSACDHMRRLLDVPGAMEITVRRAP